MRPVRGARRAPRLDLPDGCTALAVRENFERCCFEVLLHHPSWPVVPECDVPPRIEVAFDRVLVPRPPASGDGPIFGPSPLRGVFEAAVRGGLKQGPAALPRDLMPDAPAVVTAGR